MPKNLGEALAALRASEVFRAGLGDAFVDYFAHIKEAEFARFKAEADDQADVTAWEQNEYFDLFCDLREGGMTVSLGETNPGRVSGSRDHRERTSRS